MPGVNLSEFSGCVFVDQVVLSSVWLSEVQRFPQCFVRHAVCGKRTRLGLARGFRHCLKQVQLFRGFLGSGLPLTSNLI